MVNWGQFFDKVSQARGDWPEAMGGVTCPILGTVDPPSLKLWRTGYWVNLSFYRPLPAFTDQNKQSFLKGENG